MASDWPLDGKPPSDLCFSESRRGYRAAPSVARLLAGWQIQNSKLVGAQAHCECYRVSARI